MFTFQEYQEKAKSTAIYPELYRKIYPVLGLAGEVNELTEKLIIMSLINVAVGKITERTKKAIRDKNGKFNEEMLILIQKELGDILWYISAIATDLDLELQDIALGNLGKLAKRKEENKLQGDGDNR
jgi:NTP pyrophosphatase (non-canonical NTP hydrolase)